MKLGRLPDQYTIRARLLPALIVALPVGLATVAWFPEGIPGWSAIWGLVAWSGGTMLLAQAGRDAGKRKEALLFMLWGGKPTTRLLRYRDAANITLLRRRHAKLAALLGIAMPGANEEAANPRASDEVYETCVTFLRDRTRDREQFHLVFEENCNYGFRRNLWGMKPLGVTLTLLALAAIAAIPVVDAGAHLSARLSTVAVAAVADLVLLLGWLFVFTPRWVKVAAEAYAERLLEACERF